MGYNMWIWTSWSYPRSILPPLDDNILDTSSDMESEDYVGLSTTLDEPIVCIICNPLSDSDMPTSIITLGQSLVSEYWACRLLPIPFIYLNWEVHIWTILDLKIVVDEYLNSSPSLQETYKTFLTQLHEVFQQPSQWEPQFVCMVAHAPCGSYQFDQQLFGWHLWMPNI